MKHQSTTAATASASHRRRCGSASHDAVAAAIIFGVVGCAVAHAQDFRLQIYLSATDPGPLPAIPNPAPPNYPDLATPPEFSAQQNPTLRASSRLWLWANALDDPWEPWNGISLSIDTDGPLRLSNLAIFNPNYFDEFGRSQRRWDLILIDPIAPDQTEYPRFETVSIKSYGIPWPQPTDGYSDGKAHNVLLGFFDVLYSGAETGTVWLAVVPPGIGHQHNPNHRDFIYLGFGDDPVGPNDVGRRTALPEATFIPEPATLTALLAAGVLLSRRRR